MGGSEDVCGGNDEEYENGGFGKDDRECDSPMESPGQDEEVVCADLVEATFVEGPVIYQATCLVDYYEGKDGPLKLIVLTRRL